MNWEIKNGDKFISNLKEIGVTVLDNSSQTIEVEGQR